jgi:Ca2+-binding RTX toxin-like protein
MRLALLAALFLALAGPAHASTAQVVIADSCGSDVACGKYDAGHDVPVVSYVAAAGEANALAVSRTGDEWTLADPGAAVSVGDGCRAVDAHTAACTAASTLEAIPAFTAQLGEGDDTLMIAGDVGVLTSLDGGDGADTLTGGGERDTFLGGSGADRFDGGAGEFDALSFAGLSEGVTVDLGAGRTSDGDTVTGVEQVEGGDGRDRLLGGQRADILFGGAGDDLVRGRGGDDMLQGGVGRDVVEGGRGDDDAVGDPPQGDGYYTDRIHLSADVVRGGPGDDTLLDSGGANRLEGGPGVDSVAGGSGNDRLWGGPGADRLFGHGGRDRLTGGPGRDELDGGNGPDLLLARDGRRDLLRCGFGRDTARIDATDRVHACEIVRPRGYTGRR